VHPISKRLPSGWALGFAVLGLASLGPVLLPAPTFATSYVRMSDADLADQAPVIAVIEVLGRETGISGNLSGDLSGNLSGDLSGDLPSTLYPVEVQRVLKGHLPAGRITVRVLGGEALDGTGFKVFGAPELLPGERALLFLTPRDDGSWTPVHLMLGAFREERRGDTALALRDLSEAHEVTLPGRTLPPEPPGTVRDFERFADWLGDRARGVSRAPDYRVDLPRDALRSTQDAFTFFRDSGNCGDSQRLAIRWFKFDAGQSARWQASSSGQPGMAGGGLSALQRAMDAWIDDPGSNIRLSYLGTTSATEGTGSGDGLIVFDDPRGEVGGTFDCTTGGVLAVGGPSFLCQPAGFHGASYRQAVNGRIITQDGAGCYFGTAAGKNGEEVFTHELGHTLGLAHSSTPGALMRASAYGDGRGAQLGDDDRAAIALLYGDGESGPGPVEPQAPASPTGLRATPQSESRIRLTWVDNSFDEDRFEVDGRAGSGAFQVLGAVGAGATAANVVGLQPDTPYSFRIRACGDAGCSQPSNIASARTAGTGGPGGPGAPNPGDEERCSSDPSVLCLADNRFAVEVDWTNPRQAGSSGSGAPIMDSDDSGFFWFFNQENLELVVKLLDGRAINDHFWFFFGGLSDVEYQIRVTDTATGDTRTYLNEAGDICGQGDVLAFPDTGSASTTSETDGGGSESTFEGALEGAEVLEEVATNPCEANPDALCLLDGRFEVSVEWNNPRVTGDTGIGSPVPRTPNTGTFWFFDPSNVELVVKVLDGRTVNGKFWVFYGALTDVEYTLRVRDRVDNKTRFYHNPAGEICGRGDVQAF